MAWFIFFLYKKKRYILIILPWLPVSKHSNRTGTPAGVLYRNLSCNSVTCPDKFAALSYAFLFTLDHRTSKKKGMDKCHQISLGVRTIVGPPSTPVVRGVNSGEGHSWLLTAINEHRVCTGSCAGAQDVRRMCAGCAQAEKMPCAGYLEHALF